MKYKYIPLAILLITSFILLGVCHTGIDKTLKIDLGPDVSISGSTDIVVGGASMIQVEKRNNGVYFKCEIIEQAQWPFCQLKIFLSPRNKYGSYQYKEGLDLSEYDEIFIDAEYKGSQPEQLRIFLRNYNPAYTDFSIDQNSMKVNVLKFAPNAPPHGSFHKLSEFNVATWWSDQRQLPLDLRGEEFTNVSLIEINSAGNVKEGELEVLLRQISFRTQYISRDNLLIIILAMWVISALIYLVRRSSLYHVKLNQVNKSQHQLLKTVQALEVEKEEIDKISKRDELTQLRNRGGLSNHFTECSFALIEKQTPFCIIFIDLDYFKSINDKHGHIIGDEVLVGFSQLICNNIRAEDKLGRWGGEEFILICKNTRLREATLTAEKLCNTVDNHLFFNEITITASFGVAQMKSTETILEFIERADSALYKAKSKGRNQVQIDNQV